MQAAVNDISFKTGKNVKGGANLADRTRTASVQHAD